MYYAPLFGTRESSPHGYEKDNSPSDRKNDSQRYFLVKLEAYSGDSYKEGCDSEAGNNQRVILPLADTKYLLTPTKERRMGGCTVRQEVPDPAEMQSAVSDSQPEYQNLR